MDFNGNTDNKRARMMDGEQVHNYFNPAAAAEWGFKPNRREQQPQYMTFANEREYNVFLEIEASHRRAELVANHVDKTKAVARAHEALIRAVAECASAELAAGDSYSPEEIKLAEDGGVDIMELSMQLAKFRGILHNAATSAIISRIENICWRQS
ncbi:hypothetical protein BASA82_000623 [Batrachochytrium salamandrivorans]|nr:hypothetical protein BASA82_000623 [Batrachochytrium salamandrivorans]